MNSLRARLFVGLATLLLVAGLGAGGLAFRWAFEEANELQDAILRQVGALAANNHLRTDLPHEGDIDDEARVVIEELAERPQHSGNTKTSSPGFPAGLPDGLQTVSHAGEHWRVLVRTRPDGSRVAVSQSTSTRDDIASGSALRAVLPLAVLVPCLMLLVGFVIHYGFRPVSRLAAELDAKQSDHLEKLPLRGLPNELRPFVESINRLLEHIAIMFDQQRRFIADAAHELRTPITALSLQAENLDHAGLPPEASGRLAVLRTGIGRTARLLDQLLALARYETARASERPVTSFDRVIEDVVADSLPLAQSRSVDLGFERIGPVSVRAEPAALSTLARNLIDNALRHSPEGGRIDVSVFRQADTAVFRIHDTGPGVSETELSRLFELFFRGSNSAGEGSGLGLAIARSIVESHGGSISILNAAPLGRCGLCVTVTVPATLRPAE